MTELEADIKVALFEWRELLNFKEIAEYIMVTPKQVIDKKTFSEICAVLKHWNAKYISQGKTSHWKIPKDPSTFKCPNCRTILKVVVLEVD